MKRLRYLFKRAVKIVSLASLLTLVSAIIGVAIGTNALAYEKETGVNIVYVKVPVEVEVTTEDATTKVETTTEEVTTEIETTEVETTTEEVTTEIETTTQAETTTETETTTQRVVEVEPEEVLDPKKEAAYVNSIRYQLTIKDMVKEMNKLRKKHGVHSLKRDQILSEIAMYRAQEMADSNFVGHTRPNGEDYLSMKAVYGIEAGWFGECIGRYYMTGAEQVMGWYNSQTGHREVLLHGSLNKVGCGFAYDKDGNFIFVAIFSD